jgi:hypothetical protein
MAVHTSRKNPCEFGTDASDQLLADGGSIGAADVGNAREKCAGKKTAVPSGSANPYPNGSTAPVG